MRVVVAFGAWQTHPICAGIDPAVIEKGSAQAE